jgi:hypothetical protein
MLSSESRGNRRSTRSKKHVIPAKAGMTSVIWLGLLMLQLR